MIVCVRNSDNRIDMIDMSSSIMLSWNCLMWMIWVMLCVLIVVMIMLLLGSGVVVVMIGVWLGVC